MSADQPPPPAASAKRWRRPLRALAWTVGTLAVLAGLAAAFLPGYLKGLVIEQIREQLHREARIESISVNPLLLSARVRGLSILQADGQSELFGFDEFHTRIGLGSIFRRAPVIEELTIEHPRVRLARLAPERYNITDIVDAFLARPSSPDWPRFELNSIAVNNADIAFDDKPTGQVHKIERLQILLPALSSFADDRAEFSEPALTAIVNGQPLELKGRTRPFHNSLETTVDLHFTNLDVPTYLAYSPVKLPLRVERGRLTTAIDIAFVRAADKSLAINLKGLLKLEDLVLGDPEAPVGAAAMASVRAIEARIAEVRWPENTVRIDQLTIAAPQVLLQRDRSGKLNWQEIFNRGTPASAVTAASSSPATAAPASAPGTAAAQSNAPPTTADALAKPAAPAQPAALQFALAAGEVSEGTVQFDDFAAPDGPFHATLKSMTIRAKGLSNAEGAQAAIDSTLVTDAGETHANSATLTLKPFGITGEQTLKQVRLGRYKPYYGGVLAADLDGTAEALVRYAVGADYNLRISDSSLSVEKFAIRNNARVEFARIGALAVTGAELDLEQRSVAIGGVALQQCRAGFARDAQGGWNFEALMKAAAPAPGTTPAAPLAPPAADGRAAAPPDWTVTVGQASLERCAVQFDDQAAAQGGAAKIVLDPLAARIDGWSSRPRTRARVDLKTRMNGAGQIQMRGSAGFAPVAADLDVVVEGLDLVPLQPYVADRLDIRMTSGAMATRGKLSVALADTLSLRYRGDASVERLATTTKADGEDFLNWGSLRATGLDVAVNAPAPAGGAPAPLAVTLDELALADFYSRLIVNADGTLNVQRVVKSPGGAAATTAPAAAAMPAATPAQTASAAVPGAAPPAPVTIARVTLAGGRLNFSDRFIKPNYSADLADVNGSVTGLSSDFASRASVDIRARYAPAAPVEIKGTINPLRGNLYLDLAASVRDIELVPFTPYSQKYAGYGITKGKLSFKVKYLIEDRKLTADNTLLLDQLTFGEKVESPDATKLPVLFAVSLLKNAKGEIDLDLPVSGSLDDPQFSVFSIVVKIIVNLLGKAATAPFALIGALFGGGGEDLAYVEFPAGVAATFAPGQEEKLTKIAKALADRPGLKLDIVGRVDPDTDRDALLKRALLRKVAAQRQAEQVAQGQGSASAETMTIPPADYPRLLKLAYDAEKFEKPKLPATAPAGSAPGGPPASAPAGPSAAEMEKQMLAHITITPDELRELGERRANTAKEALAKAGIAGERMFIVAASPEPAAGAPDAKRGPRVDFVLK